MGGGGGGGGYLVGIILIPHGHDHEAFKTIGNFNSIVAGHQLGTETFYEQKADANIGDIEGRTPPISGQNCLNV